MPLCFKSKEKKIKDLPKVSLWLVFFGIKDYEEASIQLEANDTILFYTVGIVEAENKLGEPFKRERLTFVLSQHGDEDVDGIQNSLIHSIYEFTGDVIQKDDITIVIFKVTDEQKGNASTFL
ncbi:stage II sporulation protein E [Anoxybacillus vitaminiphilus]|uniref:Stage II sporulation protein E n=1 Tax=Paranoxybacillus vitaminiphilus TaxID=581036 RepID=A0A327YJM7_9BACL|nr:stage II sporulation protein E [Anoxybacillus vitaminiphilus]